MARREQPATTTAAPTSRVAESDVRLSSSTQSERKDTDGQQDTIATRAYALCEERGIGRAAISKIGLTPNGSF